MKTNGQKKLTFNFNTYTYIHLRLIRKPRTVNINPKQQDIKRTRENFEKIQP